MRPLKRHAAIAVALWVFLPVVNAAAAEQFVTMRFELVNQSSSTVKDAVLSAKKIPDIKDRQLLSDVQIQGPVHLMDDQNDDYLLIQVGDFFPGEKRVVELRQTVNLIADDVQPLSLGGDADMSTSGYRARVGTQAGDQGDCTELALAGRKLLQRAGVATSLAAGVVISRSENGRRLVTPHDWLIEVESEAQRYRDPGARLLPGNTHSYLVTEVVDGDSRRLPLFKIDQKKIEVSLKYQ